MCVHPFKPLPFMLSDKTYTHIIPEQTKPHTLLENKSSSSSSSSFCNSFVENHENGERNVAGAEAKINVKFVRSARAMYYCYPRKSS